MRYERKEGQIHVAAKVPQALLMVLRVEDRVLILERKFSRSLLIFCHLTGRGYDLGKAWQSLASRRSFTELEEFIKYSYLGTCPTIVWYLKVRTSTVL